jgi:hypothetical protein
VVIVVFDASFRQSKYFCDYYCGRLALIVLRVTAGST